MTDSVAVVGWISIQEILDFLSSATRATRLEKFQIDMTVLSQVDLKDLAFDLVTEGWTVNLYSPSNFTAFKGEGERQKINVRLR